MATFESTADVCSSSAATCGLSSVHTTQTRTAPLWDAGRRSALAQTQLMDSPPEESFDRITRLVAKLLEVPVALISLVDIDRQFFKSCLGLPQPWASDRQTPLSHSFCQHVVNSGEVFLVEDAREHPLVRDNLAIGDLNVIAYLGAPLITPTGHVLGALCAIDTSPRKWKPEQAAALTEAAGFVVTEIQSRRRAVAAAEQLALHDAQRSAAQEKFRIVFDFSSDPHLLFDETGIIDCNNACVAMSGFSDKSQLLSAHPADFSPEFQPDGRRSAEKRMEMDRIAREKGSHRFEWLHQRRDGTPLPLEVHLTCVELAGKPAMLVVWHDLTQRKRDEADMAQARLFAETVARQSTCMIFIRDMHTNQLVYINRDVETFLGYTAEQVKARGDDLLRAVHHPDDLPRILATREKLLTLPDNEVLDQTTRSRNAKGEWRWIWNRQAIFRRHPDGTPWQVMGTSQDVTEMVLAQEQLRTARDAAEAAARAKSEFLANMSHELRTPLTAILGYTDLLQISNSSAQERSTHVQIIRRNSQHLLEVLNDVLDLSKIEAGAMTVEQMVCSPAEILREIKSLMRPRAAEKQIAFSLHCPSLPDAIITDPTRLRQILLNLVGNAIKFTERGWVRIAASIEGGPLDSSSRLRFDVIDTGVGIAAEEQPKLFRAFAQADNSMTRRFGGTGLGLAISKKLTALLGGELTFTSKAGRGSTFTLVLPVGAARVEPALLPPGRRSMSDLTDEPVLSGRILVAEDGVDTQRLVSIYLESAGLSVETAPDGREAVERVTQEAAGGHPFNVVLMDMQMPELDGYAATAELRRLGFTDLPIIAFTAHALQGDRETCLKSGCDDYVSKPIDRSELLRVLEKHLFPRPRTTGTRADTGLQSQKAKDPFVQLILRDYLTGLPQQVAAMSEQLASENFSALRVSVHQLKGSGGSYGFPQITQRAAAAEASIKAGEPPEKVERAVAALVDLIRTVEGYDRARELAPAGSLV